MTNQPLLLISLACGGDVLLRYMVYPELGRSDRTRGDNIVCPRGGGRRAGSILHATEGNVAVKRDDFVAV